VRLGCRRGNASVDSEISILERPVYEMGEAARLLGLRADLARGWLDGYQRAGTAYPPVIRPVPSGDKIVTWGEFVELGYLREYRRKRVPLQRLRPVIDELREQFGTPYPLATKRPYVYDKELVLKVQERIDVPASIAIVIRSGQEIMLTPETSRFVKKVEFNPSGQVLRLRPARAAPPVVTDPPMRFRRPHVAGVAAERRGEPEDAGDPLGAVAGGHELAPDQASGTAARRGRPHRAGAGIRAPACGVERQNVRLAGHHQNRPHPFAGRNADHFGSRVLRLRRHG